MEMEHHFSLDSFKINKGYEMAEKQYHEIKSAGKKKAMVPKIAPKRNKMAEQKKPEQTQQPQPQPFVYLNPLTIEANFFLETLDKLNNQKLIQLDMQLVKLLERIMSGIESYLDKQPTYIRETPELEFIEPKELAQIKRTFNCAQCSYRMLGTSIEKVMGHLCQRHPSIASAPTKDDKKKGKFEVRNKASTILPKKVKAMMSNEVVNVFKHNYEIAEKLKVIPEYDVIEHELTNLIKLDFPDKPVRVYKFGSRLTGIGTRSSDLDIFVDIGNTFQIYEHRASNDTIAKLTAVRKALSKSRNWRITNVIEKARVPIIKTYHVSSGIECDIGFSNSLGFCNTNLVKFLFEMQPIAQYMCIFVKKWLERCRLTEQISTYGMTLMVIYFLQTNGVLPSIEQLQKVLDKKQFVGPWLANFSLKKSNKSDMSAEIELVSLNMQVVRSFLKSFFEYYSTFKFDTRVVCPYSGKNCKIATIDKIMPQHYTDYCVKNPDHTLQLQKPMVVQDPIQLNHNVTKSVTKPCVQQFVEFCRQTHLCMQQSCPSDPK